MVSDDHGENRMKKHLTRASGVGCNCRPSITTESLYHASCIDVNVYRQLYRRIMHLSVVTTTQQNDVAAAATIQSLNRCQRDVSRQCNKMAYRDNEMGNMPSSDHRQTIAITKQ